MNKAELIDAIASKTNATKAESERNIDAMLAVITESLENGDEIKLTGFGTFAVSQRKARTGRNPQTGKSMEIPASAVPTFRAGSQLKNAVKSSPNSISG